MYLMSSGAKTLISLLCVVLLAACGSSSSNRAASTTTTTTDPYAVPAVIDAAYLNKVLAAIEHVRGDVRREVFSTHQFSEASSNKLADIYDGLELEHERQVFSDASMSTNDRSLMNPGDEVLTVNTIRVARTTCVVAEVTSDNSAVVKDPTQDERVIALWSFPGVHSSNMTPWKIELDIAKGEPGSDYAC